MEIIQPSQPFHFLQQGGEMGNLTRRHDWSKTSIGTPDTWPQSLRTTVGNLLRSRFPMFLWWGPELIQFYNDAYRPSLGNEGKHPNALGQRGEECWPEIWPVIYPLMQQVLQTGEPTWMEDQLIPIYRNGGLQQVYWTFSYSLVLNDDDTPGGVLVTCMETTEAVLSQKEIVRSEKRFQNLVREATTGIIVLIGEDLKVEVVNDAYGQLIGRSYEELIGKALFSVIPEAESSFRRIIDGVRLTGEPLYLYEKPYCVNVAEGKKEGYLNLVYQPYKEGDGTTAGVMVLCQDVTAQVVAIRKTEESEAKLRSILNSAPTAIGVFAGPDMIVENPNQFFIELMGAGPDIEGKSFRQLLAGLVEEDQKFIGLIDSVRASGQPFEAKEVEVFFKAEKATRYFNISFLPLRDENGAVYAVLDVSVDVTEQVVARIQLEEKERSLSLAIEIGKLGMFTIDLETGTGHYSQQVMDWFSLERPSLPMTEIFSRIHPDDQPMATETIERSIAGEWGGRHDFVYRIANAKTGGMLYLRSIGQVHYEGSTPAGIAGIIQDETAQNLALKNIEESEAKFRSLIEEAPVATCLFVGREMVIEVANEAMIQVWGKGPHVIGKPLSEALPELKGQHFLPLLDSLFTTGNNYSTKGGRADLIVDGSLQTYYFDYDFKPLRNADGAIYAILETAVNVTEQVLARQKMEEGERKLKSLIAAAPIGIGLFIGRDLIIENPNQEFIDIVGKGPDITGKRLTDVMPELVEHGQPYLKILDDVFTTGVMYQSLGDPVNIVRNGVMHNGFYNIYYVPLFDAEGNVYGIMDIATDVTEQAASRKNLEESEGRFRKLADESPIFVFIIDADLLAPVSYWNKTWLHYTGQTAEEAFGRAWNGIIHPDDVPVVMEHYAPAFAAREPYFIPAVRVKRHDGAYRWHSFKGNPRYLPNREFSGYVGVGFDIHEQKVIEEELEEIVVRRTEELQRINKELQRSNANLEEFAHAASHDLKEPIRKITFFTHQLKDQLQAHLQEAEHRSFGRIQNATERMGNLIDDLLLYSHVSQRPHETESVDLAEKLKRVMEDLELDIAEKGATIRIGELPVIRGYRRQLQQLFQNLISNALKYSRADTPPIITITAEERTIDGNRYHVIKVQDNGIGFEQQYEDKIFQMFSRLHGKSEYSGTGVGLSIVKKVVENHNGFIEVNSKPGEGSTFEVHLPA